MKVFKSILFLVVIGLSKARGDQRILENYAGKTETAQEIGFDLESPKITDFGYWGEPENYRDQCVFL